MYIFGITRIFTRSFERKRLLGVELRAAIFYVGCSYGSAKHHLEVSYLADFHAHSSAAYRRRHLRRVVVMVEFCPQARKTQTGSLPHLPPTVEHLLLVQVPSQHRSATPALL